MWHKVSPIAFRIPYIKTWKSSWYEDKKTYRDTLWLDIKAREILKKELTGIPLGDILVSKNQETVTVVVYTIKAVLVLGKTGENKDKIESLLTRKLWVKTIVEVRDIKKSRFKC